MHAHNTHTAPLLTHSPAQYASSLLQLASRAFRDASNRGSLVTDGNPNARRAPGLMAQQELSNLPSSRSDAAEERTRAPKPVAL